MDEEDAEEQMDVEVTEELKAEGEDEDTILEYITDGEGSDEDM